MNQLENNFISPFPKDGKKIFYFRTGSMLAMGVVNKFGIAISDNLLEVLNVGSVGKLYIEVFWKKLRMYGKRKELSPQMISL